MLLQARRLCCVNENATRHHHRIPDFLYRLGPTVPNATFVDVIFRLMLLQILSHTLEACAALYRVFRAQLLQHAQEQARASAAEAEAEAGTEAAKQ